MQAQNTHSGFSQLTLVIGLTLCLLLLLFPSLLYAAGTPADWLSSGVPALQKTSALAPNIAPPIRDTDCAGYTYLPKPPNDNEPRTLCTFETPLGTIGNSNELLTGPNATLTIRGIEGVSNTEFFLPETPDSVQPVGIYSSTSLGNYLGFYKSLSRSRLQTYGSGQNAYYTLKTAPDVWLRDDTGNLLLINTAVMAYSASGNWLIADSPSVGLVEINLQTFTITPFAPALEKPCSIAPSFAKLAVSNDGRYVAVSPQGVCQNTTEPSLEIYDTTTCHGILQKGKAIGGDCMHKDIWNGLQNSVQIDTGLTSRLNLAQRPANLFFVNDQNLSFDVAYDYVTAGNFNVSSFLATVGGGAPHQLGLLGLGDSYISGQGEFQYRAGTDTANNSCHLSDLSYPFLMTDAFASYNSAACSGAKTDDVIRSDSHYKGQVRDGIEQKARNTADILSRYLPGYINQVSFADKYQPEALLLSVGGNDVGFGSIVSRCATPSKAEPVCFDNYEDRADLVNLINSKYRRLVTTFKTVKKTTPASRVYIIGYPQIAKPAGDCADNVHLSSAELLFATNFISYLNSVIKQAATEAGVFFVNTESAFTGHRLCEGPSASSAVNGFTAGGDNGITLLGHKVKFVGSESYHPTKLGHQLLAKVIRGATDNLQAAMPTPQTNLKPPGLSSSLALLQGVPATGRPLKLITNNDSSTLPTALPGSKQTVQVDGTAAALRPNGQYQASFGANDTDLGTVAADDDGNITINVTLPTSANAGYQVVHITGLNVAGDTVDIQQTINVAVTDDEPNRTSCLLVPDSGRDIDSDGIDDACDPFIAAAPVPQYPPAVRLTSNSITIGAP